ncbi:hypothetical protein [Polycladidibacter hongkongensis]|uniref:hypothetical protein n=1 Tax=Polycladidibacter hongkongensis TaxID=1647556 RepID=UPI0008331EAC|nr:hypothetical protein [Pseudovibrio hongkongensis]
MLGFICRFFGLWLSASALVALIIDCTRSLAASNWTTSSAGEMWYKFAPQSLNALQAATQRNVSPFLWDPVMQQFLQLPPWATLGPIGLLLLWLGDRNRYRTGRLL